MMRRGQRDELARAPMGERPRRTAQPAGVRDVTAFAFDLIELPSVGWRQRQLCDRARRGWNHSWVDALMRSNSPSTWTTGTNSSSRTGAQWGLGRQVSTRIDAPVSQRASNVWLKSKNPASEAVRREREEDWR
jgi:hypothetical protein